VSQTNDIDFEDVLNDIQVEVKEDKSPEPEPQEQEDCSMVVNPEDHQTNTVIE
jgi:hypothetical protein